MKFIPSDVLPGVVIIEPDVYRDHRGFFLETYQAEKYSQHGIQLTFVQDNVSFSKRGVLRGLHYQLRRPQGKLVWVVHGEIFDVAVDIRKDSPALGQWTGSALSSDNHLQVYIPAGFAHGFCVLSETALIAYKCTDYYDSADEHGILWNDPSLNIEWTVDYPVLSDRDKSYPCLNSINENDLPVYKL